MEEMVMSRRLAAGGIFNSGTESVLGIATEGARRLLHRDQAIYWSEPTSVSSAHGR